MGYFRYYCPNGFIFYHSETKYPLSGKLTKQETNLQKKQLVNQKIPPRCFQFKFLIQLLQLQVL